MNRNEFNKKEPSRTPANGRKDAVSLNKSRLQRLAEMLKRDPDAVSENILGDMLEQIFALGCYELTECFAAPSYAKEDANAVAANLNVYASDKVGFHSPARVVKAENGFAVRFA
jgi:hypothetical protein